MPLSFAQALISFGFVGVLAIVGDILMKRN